MFRLEFYSNNFQFGDFENQFPWYDLNVTLLAYNNQAKVDLAETLNQNQGDNITMTTNCSGAQNNYQWFLNNTALVDGATFLGTQTATLNLTNIQVTDAGTYHCEVTSNIVPDRTTGKGLTIMRNNITLNITPLACAISTAEQNALLALYNSTDGANWTSENDGDTTNNWNIANPIEDWFGVTVDCTNNTVTKLETLSGNNLTGTIPIEIGNLINLEVLDLENNILSGSIPPELGNLTKLTDLDFHNNQLSGNIPTELNNLINLERVFLYTNSLTGFIPNNWNNLNNLERLFLNDNQLSGNIPDFSGLVNLIHLSIIDNLFQFGDFENQFAQYQSLAIFNYNQQAKVDIEEIRDLSEGGNTTITVNCSGSQNNYQWFKDNIALTDGGVFTGTQTATLNLTNIQVASAGLYHCKVTSNIVTGLTIERNNITLNVTKTALATEAPGGIINNNVFWVKADNGITLNGTNVSDWDDPS